MKEAILYQKLEEKQVKCNVCAHRCLILPGKRGFCGVKQNKDGKLYSLVYGKAVAYHIDPIEKKPFFHFLPGTSSLSIATVGCNFTCLHCQNVEISQAPRLGNGQIEGENIPPKKIVQDALKNKLPSISYTYTEPTIFIEYALDTMKLAKNKGLKNNWVTNGYMTKEALETVAPYLDAANVDLKFFDDELYQKTSGGRLQPVLDSLKLMKKLKIWVEVTTLLIPTMTDKGSQLEDIAKFIKNELGAEVPWHISRFWPAHRMLHLPPTPLEAIDKAYEIGKKVGLKYVYVGNLTEDKRENTYCAKCGALAIKRTGYSIERYDRDGKCPTCNQDLNLVLKS